MQELKSILIDKELHSQLKKVSKKEGRKIKFITEKAIKEYLEKTDD